MHAYRLELPPATGKGTGLYTPWWLAGTGFTVALSEAEEDFLLAIVEGLATESLDPSTACFAEADFLVSGWHTADLKQPDLNKLHAAWSIIHDTLLSSKT